MDPKQEVGLLPIWKGIQNTMKTKQEPKLKKKLKKTTWHNMNKQTNKQKPSRITVKKRFQTQI